MKDLWEEDYDNSLKLQEDGTILVEFNGIKRRQHMTQEVYELCNKILSDANKRRTSFKPVHNVTN